MNKPNIKTTIVHSRTKSAWNVVGTEIGKKYKIARVPYDIGRCSVVDERNRKEAFEHAEFISYCFNNKDKVN